MTLNAIPDNRVVSHQTRAGFMSDADKAAHLAAAGPIRLHAGDSDPDMDEALRRVRQGRQGRQLAGAR
jgi:hypothetical protein